MGRAHAEDVGEDGDVGGEGEVVVGYSHWHGQALQRLVAKQTFASAAKRGGWGTNTGQNKTGTQRKRLGVNFTFAVHSMQCEDHQSAA